jgi:hypothetical protein
MLGEMIGEFSGKITGARVLEVEGTAPKVEVSFQGTGTLLAQAMTDLGTYWQTIRPAGSLYGEGRVVMMTAEGEAAVWTGFGVGTPAGPVPAARYAVAGSFVTASQQLARLNSITTAIEYNVDEDWNYSYKIWDWQASSG